MDKLSGKTALVTGASRGIGKAIALELARQGASVAINFAGNADRAAGVVSEIQSLGGKAIAIQGDVADAKRVTEMVQETIGEFGRLDILVNNAGITRDTLLMRMKESDWDAVINTNLKGVFLGTKAVTRQMMKQRSGRIINIASVVGLAGNAGQANYVAAKAGVIGLTKTTALELAPRGITVNAVAPGFIDTDMTKELPQDELKNLVPMKRFGKPEEVSALVGFLCSDEASYITGEVISINGGLY